jgi:hypothetical protein
MWLVAACSRQWSEYDLDKKQVAYGYDVEYSTLAS